MKFKKYVCFLPVLKLLLKRIVFNKAQLHFCIVESANDVIFISVYYKHHKCLRYYDCLGINSYRHSILALCVILQTFNYKIQPQKNADRLNTVNRTKFLLFCLIVSPHGVITNFYIDFHDECSVLYKNIDNLGRNSLRFLPF